MSETELGDGLEIFAYAHSLRDLKSKLGADAPDNDQYVSMAISCANKLAEVFALVSDNSEIDPLVPESAKSEEVVEEYRKRGAPALADLCARQLK